MVSRFQIEDMIAQDASGVIFRALDAETHEWVAVRRFFPFGVNGGGLNATEQADYNMAIERMADIKHPAMRAIICGACDPVDGIPFIVTEWIVGDTLQSHMKLGPIPHVNAIQLLIQALELCEEISQIFGLEAVWIETDVRFIILGAEGSNRGATFWASPLKWLGKHDGKRGLHAFIDLTEDLMNWRGKAIHEHEGGGLGGWVKWLRKTAGHAALAEARAMLIKISHTPPPAPARRMARQAAPAAAIPKRTQHKSNMPSLAASISVLTAISLGGWLLIRWNNSRLVVIPTNSSMETVDAIPISNHPVAGSDKITLHEASGNHEPRRRKTAEQLSQDAAEMLVLAQQSDAEEARKTAARNALIASRNGIFTIEDSELFLTMNGINIIFRGTLKSLAPSHSGKTLYLYFSDSPASLEMRGAITTSNAPEDLSQTNLSVLLNKPIQLEGKIHNERNGNFKRPTIKIVNRTAIQEIK